MDIGLLLFFGSGFIVYAASLLYREFVTVAAVPVEIIEQVAEIVRQTAG